MFTKILSVNIVLRFNSFKKSKIDDSDDEQAPLTSRVVIVDCSAISYIDVMGLDAIKEQYIEAQKRGVHVYLSNVQESVLDMFEKYNLYENIPKSRIYPNIQEAVTAVRQSINV
uniref:STAS domain-containing protein n=1 Tax=Panagrolaimus sp. ES5 TaxID=591445 RepID=A0AC34F2K0_9BILA